MTKSLESNIKDIGIVKENTKRKFSIELDKSKGPIKTVTPTCKPCTKISNISQNSFNVLFIAGSIPKHLKIMGITDLEFNKAIDITFENGSEERIFFEGTLVANY